MQKKEINTKLCRKYRLIELRIVDTIVGTDQICRKYGFAPPEIIPQSWPGLRIQQIERIPAIQSVDQPGCWNNAFSRTIGNLSRNTSLSSASRNAK